MFLPDIPTWCWNLLGEDAVRLSQPTHDQVGMHTRFFRTDALVARCQYEYTVIDPADEVSSFPFVCGHVARLLPNGVRLCGMHAVYFHLGCAWCQEYAARNEARACPGCHALWREIGAPCWCAPACGEAPAP